jgi:hypothetical protein
MMQDHRRRVRAASIYGEHLREEGVPIADLAGSPNRLNRTTQRNPEGPRPAMI